jgi:DNA-binding protein HU-beta
MATPTMTKSELARAIAEKAGTTQVAATDTLVSILTSTLRDGGTVTLPDFGKFSVSDRAARQGVNPSTGERMQIPASKAAKFSAAAKLKRILNS